MLWNIYLLLRGCESVGNVVIKQELLDGIGEHIQMYDDGDEPQYGIVEDCINPGEEMHLAWVNSEEAIPPQLLRYLKTNYSVKMSYSKTADRCFANIFITFKSST